MNKKSEPNESQMDSDKADEKCHCADPAASSNSEDTDEKQLQKKMEEDSEQENKGAVAD